jgi:hypothetical protein
MENTPQSKGGKTAAENMTPEERTERATNAANARWNKDDPPTVLIKTELSVGSRIEQRKRIDALLKKAETETNPIQKKYFEIEAETILKELEPDENSETERLKRAIENRLMLSGFRPMRSLISAYVTGIMRIIGPVERLTKEEEGGILTVRPARGIWQQADWILTEALVAFDKFPTLFQLRQMYEDKWGCAADGIMSGDLQGKPRD